MLRLKNPQKVTALIPLAKTFEHQRQQLVAVPHRLEEVKILNNIGINAPSPIMHYYDWSGPFTPAQAQKETAAFLTLHNRAYVLSEMGTGKTLSALWAWDYLRQQGQSKRLIVVAPLSTLERTWADEIAHCFPHLDYAVLHGERSRRAKLLNQDVDIYIVNHDGVKVLQDELIKRPDIDTVIIDELSQVARNATTRRWKAIKQTLADKPRMWGMTGTPIPNEPTDAWAQIRLVTPENAPPYYTAFRDLTMQQLGMYKWVPRPEAIDVVYERMQPSIRYKRADVTDLPPVMFETRDVALTKEQQQAYSSMRDELAIQHANGEITAANEAVKIMKLVQICVGSIYDADGETVMIPSQSRLKVLDDIIEEAAAKVIVFVPFKSAVAHVTEHVSKRWAAAFIHGDVSSSNRNDILYSFQHETDPHVLVAQPATMSHGLTLTAANVIVWFAPISSCDVQEQANARITRPGQKYSQLIIHIQGSPIEAQMYKRLREKASLQGLLLNSFEKSGGP